jgi:hypothetical protein
MDICRTETSTARYHLPEKMFISLLVVLMFHRHRPSDMAGNLCCAQLVDA